MSKDRERRRDRRASVSAQATEVDGNRLPTGLLLDVSKRGLRLAVDGPVPLGEEVQLRLDFGDAVVIRATVRVVWCRQCAPYEVGTQIIALEPEQSHVLERIIQLN